MELGFVSDSPHRVGPDPWSRANGVPVGPGRGSAAELDRRVPARHHEVDRLRYDLRRVLPNSARVSMPEIHIDFCKDGREKVRLHAPPL